MRARAPGPAPRPRPRPARPILEPGDIVDVIAPGSRCSDQSLAAGVAFLERLGLTPRVPRTLFGRELLCANTDAVRFAHLSRALAARDSRVLWCVRGGYGAIRLVDRLLKLAPPPRPKLLVGYSDATTLHYLLNERWGWPSLHGPLLDRLGAAVADAPEVQELRALLLQGRPESVYSGLQPLNAAARRVRTLRARVFGGNLSVLQSLLGTPLQARAVRPRQILFLEDVGERGYRIDRMLEHLRQAGALRGVAALVFGTFTGGAEPDGRTRVPEVLERFAVAQSFPVLGGLTAGHGELQRPLFLHTRAQLTCGTRAQLTVSTPELR